MRITKGASQKDMLADNYNTEQQASAVLDSDDKDFIVMHCKTNPFYFQDREKLAKENMYKTVEKELLSENISAATKALLNGTCLTAELQMKTQVIFDN